MLLQFYVLDTKLGCVTNGGTQYGVQTSKPKDNSVSKAKEFILTYIHTAGQGLDGFLLPNLNL